MQTEVIRPSGLFVMLEGCRIPALDIKFIGPSKSYGAMSIVIPYHPSLFTPRWTITERAADAETIVDENGITIINDVEVSGIQPQTRVQVFMKDPYSGESVLIQDGRIIGGVTKVSTPDNAYLSFAALCSGAYPQEIQIYMTDNARSLGISTDSDWSGELGSSSPSEIATRIQSAGLSQGILAELENAGLNSNYFLHILWRMMRYKKRFKIVDNPKALGYFNGSRIETIFDKTLSKYKNKDSIAKIISYILSLLRYNSFNMPFPSFINETQNTGATEIEDTLDNDADINVADMMINDWICCPRLGIAPPPRCNVIFTNQYGQMNAQYVFNQQPTRMIIRATGTGKLTAEDSSDAIVKPDSMKDKLLSNRNYNSPVETYRGIIFSSGALDAPEFMSEMGSDYVKGFYEHAYNESQHGLSVDIGTGTFNPRIVPGLPCLVFDRDGDHIIGDVDVTHSFSPDGTIGTTYTITNARPYDTPITTNAGDLWYEQNIFGPEHIGIYFYPQILGKYDGEKADLDWNNDDMSILAILNNGSMTDEEVRAAKEDPLAIKHAADAIFEEYNNTPNKTEYAMRFGRRSQITFRQYLEEFYGCSISADEMMATGGYSLATNTMSIFEGDGTSEITLGNRIPDDAMIRGCYFRERQEAYVQAMQFFLKTQGLPIDDTYMQGVMNASAEAIRQLINSVEPDSAMHASALGILGILEAQ